VSDIDRLLELIRETSENIETADIKIDGLSPEMQELGDAICTILRQGQEITRFVASLSDGNLMVPVPSRSNYMAGSVKDLYYKLKHLEWQTNQVAGGDYSQKVDFLGSFSDAFNSMTEQLKQREDTIRRQAREQVETANREKQRMERQMEIQYVSYQAYREYIESFLKFRMEYQTMMGEVYALFQQKKYEEGRQLIAQINDRMGSRVNIRRDYSNHDYINAALTDIASYCKKRGVELEAMIHVPNGFFIKPEESIGLINHMSELVYFLVALSESEDRSVKILSSQKSVWLSIIVRYFVPDDILAEELSPDIKNCIKEIREITRNSDAIFSMNRSEDGHSAECILHLSDKGKVSILNILFIVYILYDYLCTQKYKIKSINLCIFSVCRDHT